jgi:hypothetical protein
MALGLLVSVVAIALRRRCAQVGENAINPIRLRRRERMAQSFARFGFGSPERMERQRFIAERQGPLAVERARMTRRAAGARRVVHEMRRRVPNSVAVRLLTVAAAGAGAVALAGVNALTRDTLRALDVEAHTAALTALGLVVLLGCAGVLLGELLTPGTRSILGIPAPVAVVAASAILGFAFVLNQIAPAGPEARFGDAVAKTRGSCEAARGGLQAGPVCREWDTWVGRLRDEERKVRSQATLLPVAAAAGAWALVRCVYEAATLAAALYLRRLNRSVAVIERRMVRGRAQYQADVIAAAETAGVTAAEIAAA